MYWGTERVEPNNRVVSSEDELLFLVDREDREIGFLAKADAHRGRGTLHRAFSLFVFNPAGDLLLQQRAEGKRRWPGLVQHLLLASTPWREDGQCVRRRLQEELGISAELEFLFKFRYQAQYDDQGAEHELCWVYAGQSAERPRANVHEVAAWRYVSPQALQTEIARAPETFTPWLKLAWMRISLAHAPVVGTTRTG